MVFANAQQAQLFLSALYGGIAIGLCYDALRALRLALRAGRALTAVLDVLFAAAMGAVVLFVIVAAADGTPHGYLFPGFGCGALLYALSVSRVIVRALTRFFSAIRSVFVKIARHPAIKRFFR